MSLKDRIKEAAAAIQPHLTHRPSIALILGSGLGGIAESIDEEFSIDFECVPYVKAAGAPSHVGRFVFGEFGGRQLACMRGRLHAYEGNTPEEIVFPLQVLHELGAKRLIVTNAAGGINTSFTVGDIMMITDHINLTGATPMTLDEDSDLTTFTDMSRVYTPALRKLAFMAAESCGLLLEQGVYLGVRGPNFETPAEVRAFRTWGADAVGMSTIFEVLAAASLGMDVLGLSLITNMAAGIFDQPITGEGVLETSKAAAARIGTLLLEVLRRL